MNDHWYNEGRWALLVIMVLLMFLVGKELARDNWRIDFGAQRVIYSEGVQR